MRKILAPSINIHSGTRGGQARRARIGVDYKSALDKAQGNPDQALDLLVKPGGHAKQRGVARDRLQQLAKTWVAPKPVARPHGYGSSSISSSRQSAMNMGAARSMNNSFTIERSKIDSYTDSDLRFNFPPTGTRVRLTRYGSTIAEGLLEDKWRDDDNEYGSVNLIIDSGFYNTMHYPGATISW